MLQRTERDCLVPCLAMLLDITYEEASEYFPPKAIKETGYSFELLTNYLSVFGIFFKDYDIFEDFLDDKPNWEEPTIVIVPSKIEKGELHSIFWDGEKVIDPSLTNKYTELPSKGILAYQLVTKKELQLYEKVYR